MKLPAACGGEPGRLAGISPEIPRLCYESFRLNRARLTKSYNYRNSQS